MNILQCPPKLGNEILNLGKGLHQKKKRIKSSKKETMEFSDCQFLDSVFSSRCLLSVHLSDVLNSLVEMLL